MMTLYLLFDALEQHRLTLDSNLRVSAHSASMPPTKMGLRPGSSISVEDAIYSIIIKSANDVAATVGENLGGSEQRFAQIMTRTARQLGMRSTTFRNASGLPDDEQVTTARDMATLARHLITDHPEYYHYFGAEGFSFRGRRINTHNPLVVTYPGMDGLKTGYIRAAGYNLASSAVRGGRRLVGVVLGGHSTAARNQLMVRILDAAWQSVPQKPLVAGLTPDVQVASASSSVVPAVTRSVYIPKAAPQVVAPSMQGFVDTSVDADEEVQTSPAVARIAPASPRAPRSAAPSTGGYALQVGAFRQRAAALDTAKSAIARIRGLPRGVSAEVTRANRGKTVYLARIVGFGQDSAERACSALKRVSQACFVVRDDESVASN